MGETAKSAPVTAWVPILKVVEVTAEWTTRGQWEAVLQCKERSWENVHGDLLGTIKKGRCKRRLSGKVVLRPGLRKNRREVQS